MNEVIMTIGRHGIPDMDFGIMGISMMDAYFSAKKFKTYGKTLILSSPIQRAVITAKIRQKALNCELQILDELSQNFFFGLKSTERAENVERLRGKIFQLTESGDYSHIHIITHMPIMDLLNLPVCEDCEFVEIKTQNWQEMKKTLLLEKIPYKRGESGRPQSLEFMEKNGSIPDLNYQDFLEFMAKNDC